MNDCFATDLTTSRTRRGALRVGGALLAAGLLLPHTALAQGTPVAGDAGDLLLIQSFSQGSLFPTQGDPGVLPYTMTLWDAAARGLVYLTSPDGSLGFAPTDALIAAITAGERPRAAVVIPAAPDGSIPEQVWALTLAYASPGSDADSVTYQGEPMPDDDAAAWLGMAPASLPDGPRELAAGYLLIAGLPGLDLPDVERPRIALA